MNQMQEFYIIRDGNVPYESTYPTLVLHISEADKTIETVSDIWSWLLSQQATRRAVLVAVGGGVLTDMVGFAAATYKRGIRWISVPTTLLSMVDAGSGGKTGFNFGGIKNSIGAFHAPVETRIDVSYLATLPGDQILSGYAEMVKHCLLADLPYPDAEHLTEADIRASIAVKDRIVAEDPTEQGIRKALNFGHTIGHALEALSLSRSSENGEKPLLHGYAVLYGMVAELYLSHVCLGLDKQVVSEVAHLLTEYYGRPALSCRQYPLLLERMRQDKKGPLNFTLLRRKGEPVINQTINEDLILEALDYLFSI